MSDTPLLQARQIKRLGWRRPLPNPFKPKFSHYKATLGTAQLPPRTDLRPKFSAISVYDQGDLGSCTANALAALHQYRHVQAGGHSWVPSRLFIYYYERVIEHTVNEDSGASLEDGVRVLEKLGVPPESLWLYDVNKFAKKPPQAAVSEAAKHKARSHLSVDNTDLAEVQTAVSSGSPVAIGITVFSSFLKPKDGHVTLPKPKKEELLGGHAVVIVGYDNSKQYFIVRNSWGRNWGIEGYFTLPYAYVLNLDLTDDCWVINDVA